MAAFYKAKVAEFLALEPAKIMLDLTSSTASRGFALHADQHSAWIIQAEVLSAALQDVLVHVPSARDWGLLLEYEIPGRPRRIDAVLLDHSGIIVLEFKVGADEFRSGDKWQLREYCWDLRDFHQESEGIPIAPILVATEGPESPVGPVNVSTGFDDEHKLILPLHTANSDTLSKAVLAAHRRLEALGRNFIELEAWNCSQTHTTRTIVEEAQRLFGAHDVREIHHAHADNTTEARLELIEIVRKSRENGLRSICFLTGIPGAGKTLVGLQAAYSSMMREAAGRPACFASGNKPLLDVIEAALTMNRTSDPSKQRQVKHELSEPVRNVHDFAISNLLDPYERAPNEHVVVFDEAQRVWTDKKVKEGIKKRVRRRMFSEEQASQLLNHAHSEPHLLLRVMERCPGWCVVIALVGGGQEIHEGEAGLAAWGAALVDTAEKWTIWTAPAALEGHASVAGQTLFPSGKPAATEVRISAALHLSTAKRSPRAEKYAEWVNLLLAGKPESASRLMGSLSAFPILLTRDLKRAKQLIADFAGEKSRFGLLASSGAMRLRADGIELKREFRNSIEYPDWFLRPSGDIRSSNQLEIAATEFECQGLELDWTLVCWGGDFIRSHTGDHWVVRRFINGGKKGPHWRVEKNPNEQEFIRNKYRVLLTRARFGTVLYIPPGDTKDLTRNMGELDSVTSYLERCGLPADQPPT